MHQDNQVKSLLPKNDIDWTNLSLNLIDALVDIRGEEPIIEVLIEKCSLTDEQLIFLNFHKLYIEEAHNKLNEQ